MRPGTRLRKAPAWEKPAWTPMWVTLFARNREIFCIGYAMRGYIRRIEREIMRSSVGCPPARLTTG